MRASLWDRPHHRTNPTHTHHSTPHHTRQVTLGQMKDQGVRVASRCLWDTATDNYASVEYANQHLWCSAMVFGVYTE